jgi:flagellar motor component MotA
MHSSQATTTASPAKSVRVTVMAASVAPALTVVTVVVSVVTALSKQSKQLPQPKSWIAPLMSLLLLQNVK